MDKGAQTRAGAQSVESLSCSWGYDTWLPHLLSAGNAGPFEQPTNVIFAGGRAVWVYDMNLYSHHSA